jgi:hypothetical protein
MAARAITKRARELFALLADRYRAEADKSADKSKESEEEP